MTIAAGLIYDSGVLLCSDSQVEQGASKTLTQKLGFMDCQNGRLAFAIAGASDFALSALQRVREECHNYEGQRNESLKLRIQQILAEEYKREVLENPQYLNSPNSYAYWLLLGLFRPEKGVQLFRTNERAMVEVRRGYDCIGIGLELAKAVLGPSTAKVVVPTEKQALLSVAHTLGKVKENVPGCGGYSQYLLLRNDGSIHIPDTFPLEQFEKLSRQIFDSATERLRIDCGDTEKSDEWFEQSLDALGGAARSLRRQFKEASRPDPLFRNERIFTYPPTT